MKTRYSYGGDEHIFAEMDEEMSLDAFFKALFITNAVRDAKIKGVTEICPANASMQIKFDPDVIKPADMLAELKTLEKEAEKAEPVIKTRIIEIPVYYNDPWTHETLMRFRERHQDPKSTDIEYAARINDLGGPDGFIKAHSSAPWFVSMVGFVAGFAYMGTVAERIAKDLQIMRVEVHRRGDPGDAQQRRDDRQGGIATVLRQPAQDDRLVGQWTSHADERVT